MAVTERLDWVDYYLNIAEAVSRRGECVRSQVGAIVVQGRDIVATGYNGAPAGARNCLDGGCPRASSDVEPGSSYDTGPGRCISLHAEQNALLRASRYDLEGSVLYVTREPCDGCWKMLRGSGLDSVVWPHARYGFTKRSVRPA